MSAVTRVAGLFRGRPVHPVGADGRMALTDHFRELRARLMRIVAALLVLFILGLIFNSFLLELVMEPYNQARQALGEDVVTQPTMSGSGGPLLAYMKLAGVAALVFGSPVWLYQIWAFILPGLHREERKWTLVFLAVAGPLFMGGVALGYYVLPKGLEVLIGFTAEGFTNLVEFNQYFSFLSRMLLIFGIGFQIPLFAILLNLAGILSGRAMAEYRPFIIVGTFIFAAVATPSTDPFSMAMLAVPLVVLFFISEVVMRLLDKRKAAVEAQKALTVDQASKLP
ncbi:twin-arginine translocase subunit TatC [Alteromonas gracilis]